MKSMNLIVFAALASWSSIACTQDSSRNLESISQAKSEGSQAGDAAGDQTSNRENLGEAPVTPIVSDPVQETPAPPVADQPQKAQLALGELAYGGKACAILSEGSLVTQTETDLEIHLATVVAKTKESAIERGACTMALPITVPAGYRLVISKITVDGSMFLSKGATINGLLEVFTTGTEESASLEFNGKATRGSKMINNRFEQEAEIVSDCGAGLNLRSNSSFLIRGGQAPNSADRSQAIFAGLKIKYELQACQ